MGFFVLKALESHMFACFEDVGAVVEEDAFQIVKSLHT